MSVSGTGDKLFARACIPPGMDSALEGLAREVLKEQPRDIYLFAAKHFQRLVQIRDKDKDNEKTTDRGVAKVKVATTTHAKAHSAGLSPSSTQASENAGLIPDTPTEPIKQLADEVVITSQDAVREISLDTNGAPKTGIGLGPGVAALAASTGTVAILGATADTTLEAVDDVKQVAADVVQDVKEAAEEAVKDVKTGAENLGKAAEDVVENVDEVIKSPSLTPVSKEAQSVTTSPVQEDNLDSKEVKKDLSVPTSPVPDETKSDGIKEGSLPTSPVTEDNIPPVESKETSVQSSPVPEEVNKETGEIKEEVSLSISSLPEDSIPSSIKEDVIHTSSPSANEEKQESLVESEAAVVKSPTEELEGSNAAPIVTGVQRKADSRPTSAVKADSVDKTQSEVVEDAFPDPPPPEIEERASADKQDETEAASRNKRSLEETIEEKKQQTQSLLEEESRPVVELEKKIEEVEEKSEEIEVAADEEAAEADRLVAAVADEIEKASSVQSQNPQIEVSAPSRPQSSDMEFAEVTSQDVEVKQEVHETAEQVVEKVGPEAEVAEIHEVIAPSKDLPEEAAPARPTSAQVEEKAEEVVNDVVQTVTEMVTTAATTIQATFRGHQTRQNLRKIADQDELTDAMSSELDRDADVTLSLDAKSSDTKEELSETVEDSFPPPLNDGDSELLSSSTEKEELQPVVNVTINAEAAVSLESLVDSEKVSEEKTLPSESEKGSLEERLENITRAASVVSESTVSIGDSISALKGSETASTVSANEDLAGDSEGKKGAAATTIQASFRGFQTRQNLQKIVDDTQLPVPEPLQDFPFEDVADEDDLPPPPEECDIEPPPPEVVPETPRSPETGEKLKKPAAEVSGEPNDDKDQDQDGDKAKEDAAKLALLQRPQQCDELPEHRGEVPVEALPSAESKDAEQTGDVVNGILNADASSAEVDDSSLSSAATKIQAGARGYLTRKLMKDTFSTTAPSITDSQSMGATLTSDDGFHTSGSLETEVQRQKSVDEQKLGVTAVVIANIGDKAVKSTENGFSISGLHEEIVAAGKGLSLDSQLPQEKKKAVLATASSENNAKDAVEDKQVWQTLQGEMEEAATKIQSNFRGYRTRQRLHRENAVQVTTSSGTPGTTSECSEAPSQLPAASPIRSSGEFHDLMVLPPDPPAADVTSDSWSDDDVGVGVGVGVDDDALARRQPPDLGTRLEGHVIDVATPATDVAVSAMGKARETTSPKESSVREMKGASVAKAAATKIQAGFRGYKVRKQMKQMKEKKNGPRRRSSVQPTPIAREKMTLQERSATTIQAGVRGFLVRKRRLEEKNAAVKIQAGFRGYKVRRDVKTRAPVEK